MPNANYQTKVFNSSSVRSFVPTGIRQQQFHDRMISDIERGVEGTEYKGESVEKIGVPARFSIYTSEDNIFSPILKLDERAHH